MKEDKNIANLLQLLDVHSAEVREQVIDTLIEYGPTLDNYIDRHHPVLNPEQQFYFSQVAEKRHSKMATQGWMQWLSAGHPVKQLEAAMHHLAQLHTENPFPPLSDLLDDLAEEFTMSKRDQQVLELSKFLFADGRLRGSVGNYYHPRNSHLPSVILKGEGLPISLALVFMMVAYRLNYQVRGFNLPGHFLAVAEYGNDVAIIDCFDRGTILDQRVLHQQLESSHISVNGLLKMPPQPTDIIRRVLLNILNAYRSIADQSHFDVYQLLLHQLNEHTRKLEEAALAPDNVPNFKPGDLIRHVRYGYRGVVVEVHQECKASEEWYQASVVRPSRKQPWYHILVDCSDTTTYAAQSSLMPDDVGAEIQHPLIHVYFDAFRRGIYKRNDMPWNHA